MPLGVDARSHEYDSNSCDPGVILSYLTAGDIPNPLFIDYYIECPSLLRVAINYICYSVYWMLLIINIDIDSDIGIAMHTLSS